MSTVKEQLYGIGCFDINNYDFGGFYKKYPFLTREIKTLTQFLNITASIPQRVWHILNDLNSYPTCIECGKEVIKWESTKKKYVEYCSAQCSKGKISHDRRVKAQKNLDQKKINEKRLKTIEQRYGNVNLYHQDIALKRKQTMLQRYGVLYTAQSSILLQKMKDTCIRRYGVSNIFLSPTIRDLIRKANFARYGTYYYQQTDVGKRQRQYTWLQKYGTISPLQSREVRSKIEDTNLKRYGVRNVFNLKSFQERKNKTIQEKYGRNNVQQLHLSEKQLSMLEDVNFLIQLHHHEKKTLVEISNIIGVDPKTISNRFSKYGIEIKRFSQSTGEREIVEFLTSMNIVVFNNKRDIIPPYEVDIFLPEFNLAIEYCGLYWHSDIHPRITKTYHQQKFYTLEEKGIRLLTIFEDEWLYKKDIVKNTIKQKLGIGTFESIYARKCKIAEPNNKERDDFLNLYHIQGTGRGSKTYSLTYEDKIVACMTFIQHSTNEYELNRYAAINVIGGFSKLLKQFLRDTPNCKQIISYADLRYHTGEAYINSGFTFVHDTLPSYSYIVKDKRIHRSHFRRKNLPNMLKVYDPLLTEFENCDLNGILRIWDCGLRKFIFLNE